MGTLGGIAAKQLGVHTSTYGAVPYHAIQATVAGTSSYTVFAPGVPQQGRVTRFTGVMTGNGAAGDTVQLQDQDGNAITEAIDVSALSTNDHFASATLVETYRKLKKGDSLLVVTASGALCEVCIEITPYEETT